MEVVVLTIHIVVCACLIGLVLLQRSEGGALGMGGGGGGSLMSGRGAADALAKMTQVAGGFFLATSLTLTFLANAGSNPTDSSIFDSFPASQSAPAPTPAAPAQTPATTPDPTESSAPQAAETQLAAITPAPTPAAAAPATNAARAAPLAATPAPTTTRPATTQPASTRPAATQRSASGTTPTSASGTQTATRPLTIPNTSGASGAALTLDPEQIAPESSQAGSNGVEAVRRERAGPDQ